MTIHRDKPNHRACKYCHVKKRKPRYTVAIQRHFKRSIYIMYKHKGSFS